MSTDEALSLSTSFVASVWATILWATPNRPDGWTHAADVLTLISAYFAWRSFRWMLVRVERIFGDGHA